MSLEDIITKGTFVPAAQKENIVICADGFRMSVIANWGAYCRPRPEHSGSPQGPFTHVEVGFPSVRPEPWSVWSEYCDNKEGDPCDTVYGYVPVYMVRALVELHGGENE